MHPNATSCRCTLCLCHFVEKHTYLLSGKHHTQVPQAVSAQSLSVILLKNTQLRFQEKIAPNAPKRHKLSVHIVSVILLKNTHLCFQENIAPNAPKRHKLSVHIVSRAGEQNGTESDTAATGTDTPDGLMPAPPLPQVHSLPFGAVFCHFKCIICMHYDVNTVHQSMWECNTIDWLPV